jgi:hypothetical protein
VQEKGGKEGECFGGSVHANILNVRNEHEKNVGDKIVGKREEWEGNGYV